MKYKYHKLKKWFNKYTEKFNKGSIKKQENINLKITHSKRVSKNMEEIIEGFEMSENERYLAKIIALFHDIGRFKQYEKYNTFSDYKSDDHGIIGVKVIKKNNLINDIKKDYQDIIYKAIKNHNNAKLNLNNFKNDKELLYAKLIRDADKLDIWNIFMDKYKNENENNYLINLSYNPKINDEIYNKVLNRESIKYNKLETVNELKLMQMSWVYDINFKKSLEIIEKRNYIKTIYNSMDKSEKADKIYNNIKDFIENEKSCTL